VLSINDIGRWVRGVVFDWLPLMGVLLLYDLSNGVRTHIGIQPHVWPQIDVDRALSGGVLPTERLQHALYDPGVAHFYDYGVWGVYLSHFFVTLIVAALLWRFAPERFKRWRNLVVGLATMGFVTYILFPAVPPWLAAYDHHIDPVHRVIAEMWQHTGIAPASALFENHSGFYNQVAAIPSLHAAYPLMLLMFCWSWVGRWARAGLIAYVMAMAFTLVYTGEHYFADILVGWVYAVGAYTAVTAAERAWARRRARAPTSGLERPGEASPARAG
jgi:hypothetical protein